jgi:hypothetical protein
MATTKSTQNLTLKTDLSSADRVAFVRQESGVWKDYAFNLDDISNALSKSDTYANISTDKTNGDLIPNTWYYLSDKDIYVFATTTSKFGVIGFINGYNADYQNAGSYSAVTIANGFAVNATGTNGGIWYSAMAAPTAGDVYIYNDTHYLNKTGAVGTAPSGDTTNWEVVSDSTTPETRGYILEVDQCGYDFDSDAILYRLDRRGNEVFGATNQTLFPWGNNSIAQNIIRAQVTLSALYNARVEVKRNILEGGRITYDEDGERGLFDSMMHTQMDMDFSGLTGGKHYRYMGRTMDFNVKLTSANVLALNSTPINIVEPNSQAAIKLVSAEFFLDYNSATYATNTTLVIYSNTITEDQATGTTFLAATNDSFRNFTISNTDDNLVSAGNLTVAVSGGDPITGDSPVWITGTFRMVAPELNP